MQQKCDIRYQVNDYVIYGGNGVCVVEDICTLDGSGIDNSRVYYRLKPLYEKGSMVYAPVDNLKSTLRDLLSETETLALIDEFPEIEIIKFQNDKTLDMDYKNALRSYNGRELLRVMKTAFLRMRKRQEQNKKVVMVDEKYFHKAKELLFGEWAVVLHSTKEDVENLLKEHITEEDIITEIA